MKKFVLSFIAWLFIIMPLPMLAQLTGGPDKFGYVWSQYSPGTGSKWVELTNDNYRLSGDFLDLTDLIKKNRNIGPITFQFQFPYYWYHHQSLYINGAGYISFKPITHGTSYDQIPTRGGEGDDYIAPLLTPLSFMNAPYARLYFWHSKDSLVVTWEDVPYFVSASQSSGAVTFQVILTSLDSSITFNYAKKQGSYNNTPCPGTTPTPPDMVANCQMIGIENMTGDIGLLHSKNNETIFAGISKSAPLTIRFAPGKIKEKNYTVKDVGIKWNNNKDNGGIFVSQKGNPLVLKTQVRNMGNTQASNLRLQATFGNATNTLLTANKKFQDLEMNEEYLVSLDQTIKPDSLGIYTYETSIQYLPDELSGNNRLAQFVQIVDTTTETILDYSNGVSSGTGFTFLGATTFDRGIGVYIEPPYYPARITKLKFGVSGYPTTGSPPSVPIRLRIFDDNGTNVYGLKDGSPGDILYQNDLNPNIQYQRGYNTLNVNSEIQINSGGVYVALMQGGQGVAYMVNDQAPHSYRTFEVNDPGGFLIWRRRALEDFLLGVSVVKGDMSKTHDLLISEIRSPETDRDYTDSVVVSIVLTNIGPDTVKGPVDLYYTIDGRAEVHETVNSSLEILPGSTYEHKFKKKTPRPYVPRTRFNSVCTRFVMDNDFDLSNNELCKDFVPTSTPENLSSKHKLRIHPNPSENWIQIIGSSDHYSENKVNEVFVYNLQGEVVIHESFPSLQETSIELDISKLYSGRYYFVRFGSERIWSSGAFYKAE